MSDLLGLPCVHGEDATVCEKCFALVESEKLQFLIDWADKRGYLPDHTFTFPDGDVWHASQDLQTP